MEKGKIVTLLWWGGRGIIFLGGKRGRGENIIIVRSIYTPGRIASPGETADRH